MHTRQKSVWFRRVIGLQQPKISVESSEINLWPSALSLPPCYQTRQALALTIG